MAIKNPLGWFRRGPAKVVPFPAQPGAGLPVATNGQVPTPHEFLQAQIINLPDEEESIQKRALLALIYTVATWGGSLLMIVLGVALANDLAGVFRIAGMYAFALALLFPFGELLFEALAILVGERIHQGLKSGGDIAFVGIFGPFVILANIGTAMLQVFLLSHGAPGELTAFAAGVLWFRAFLPLLIVIATIGVVAGIQRRSLRRMINALHRKSEALTAVAQASVHFLEADMNARRAIDEHEDARKERDRKEQAFEEMQRLMKGLFEKQMERLNKLDEDNDNGNGRRGRY